MKTKIDFIDRGINKKIVLSEAYLMNAHISLQYIINIMKSEQKFTTNTNIIFPTLYNIVHGMELFFKGVYSYINKTDKFSEIKNIGGSNGHDLISMFNKVLWSLREKKYSDDNSRSAVISCFSTLVNPLQEIWKLSEKVDSTIIFRYGERKNVVHPFIKDKDCTPFDIKEINEMLTSMKTSMSLVNQLLHTIEK